MVAGDHFNGNRGHGVYVIQQAEKDKEVIYIGKGGSVNQDGRYKLQGLVSRLTNTRGESTANNWFSDVVHQYGTIVIEYVFLPDQLNCCAAYIEACLLQSYLTKHGRLPYLNRVFDVPNQALVGHFYCHTNGERICQVTPVFGGEKPP